MSPTTRSDQNAREKALAQWLTTVGEDPSTLRAVAEDAGSRRYFRIDHNGHTRVAVDSPPDREDNAGFLAIAAELKAANVRVPQQHGHDLENGFLLMEDLGDTTFALALTPDSQRDWYLRATDLLASLHALPTQHRVLYARPLIERELDVFIQHYLGAFNAHLTSAESAEWARFTDWICDAFDTDKRVWTHRDFHSRNLMVSETHSLGLIDFQGALLAPAGYDLASLLRDCYTKLPDALIDECLVHYAATFGGQDTEALQRGMDVLGLQRHLKCLGAFIRFDREQGKSGYLSALPLTAHYATRVARRYPEAEIVLRLLQKHPVDRFR